MSLQLKLVLPMSGLQADEASGIPHLTYTFYIYFMQDLQRV